MAAANNGILVILRLPEWSTTTPQVRIHNGMSCYQGPNTSSYLAIARQNAQLQLHCPPSQAIISPSHSCLSSIACCSCASAQHFLVEISKIVMAIHSYSTFNHATIYYSKLQLPVSTAKYLGILLLFCRKKIQCILFQAIPVSTANNLDVLRLFCMEKK